MKKRLINNLIADLDMEHQAELMELCGYKSRQGFLKMLKNPDNITAGHLSILTLRLNELYYINVTMDTMIRPISETINQESHVRN